MSILAILSTLQHQPEYLIHGRRLRRVGASVKKPGPGPGLPYRQASRAFSRASYSCSRFFLMPCPNHGGAGGGRHRVQLSKQRHWSSAICRCLYEKLELLMPVASLAGEQASQKGKAPNARRGHPSTTQSSVQHTRLIVDAARRWKAPLTISCPSLSRLANSYLHSSTARLGCRSWTSSALIDIKPWTGIYKETAHSDSIIRQNLQA
jgi:hypothetical protein